VAFFDVHRPNIVFVGVSEGNQPSDLETPMMAMLEPLHRRTLRSLGTERECAADAEGNGPPMRTTDRLRGQIVVLAAIAIGLIVYGCWRLLFG